MGSYSRTEPNFGRHDRLRRVSLQDQHRPLQPNLSTALIF